MPDLTLRQRLAVEVGGIAEQLTEAGEAARERIFKLSSEVFSLNDAVEAGNKAPLRHQAFLAMPGEHCPACWMQREKAVPLVSSAPVNGDKEVWRCPSCEFHLAG